MTVTETMNRPNVKVIPRRPLRHIFHHCTFGKNPETAYCGHQSGPGTGVQYRPTLPDVCIVCTELFKDPCNQCGKW